jgi:hypothetical protein
LAVDSHERELRALACLAGGGEVSGERGALLDLEGRQLAWNRAVSFVAMTRSRW